MCKNPVCRRTNVRFHSGLCPACYAWRTRHGTLPERRSAGAWTDAQNNYLLFNIGYQSLTTIARKLGRTPLAVHMQAKRLGIAPGTYAKRREGMSARDVQEALGVARATVSRWIDCGWLKATRAPAINRRLYTISHDDLTAFLYERGALFPLKPNTAWQPIVAEARADVEKRLISIFDVADMICVSRRTFRGYHGSFADFPRPALSWSRIGGIWCERAAVREWLTRHPQYQTKAAQERI